MPWKRISADFLAESSAHASGPTCHPRSYRHAISKTAGGQVQPQASSDLSTWNSRGLSQTLLSKNEATATVELAVPALGKIYTRLKADVPAYYPDMIKVAGGALPADSRAGAQSVDAF